MKGKKAIGGYFEIETSKSQNIYHSSAIALNSGRNCLGFIYQLKPYTKIYIPYFTCKVILEPLKSLGIEYQFYHIDKYLDPVIDFELKSTELFLYTNYFGIKNKTISNLISKFGEQLIVDASQAFFSTPISDNYFLFNSCRKFFGVLDGAYLYLPSTYRNEEVNYTNLNRASYSNVAYLINRLDQSAEFGYENFRLHENELRSSDVAKMSAFTNRILSTINYNEVSKIRIENFNTLHSVLANSNKLNLEDTLKDDKFVPFVYPYLSDSEALRETLINNRIYVAKYWDNVLQWTTPDSIESHYTNNIIPLPIDQRYDKEDMQRILNIILR